MMNIVEDTLPKINVIIFDHFYRQKCVKNPIKANFDLCLFNREIKKKSCIVFQKEAFTSLLTIFHDENIEIVATKWNQSHEIWLVTFKK